MRIRSVPPARAGNYKTLKDWVETSCRVTAIDLETRAGFMDRSNGKAWAFVEVATDAEGERAIATLPTVGMATADSQSRGREWRCLEA
eukprot:13824-Lingulodinium_polyedra.AAC.1